MNRNIIRRAGMAIGVGLVLGAGSASATPWGGHTHEIPAAPHAPHVTGAPEAPEAPAARNTERQFSFITHDDDEEVEIIVNGDTVKARVNGLAISPDRIVKKDGEVILLDDAGKQMKVISIAPRMSGLAPAPGMRFGVTVDADDISVEIERPPVMLGVLLESPSDALRAHLDLPEHALILEKVMDGLPAHKAGLEQWDIIIEVNGEPMEEEKVLHHELMESEPGDEMELVVVRAGREIEVEVDLIAYDGGRLGQSTITTESFFGDEPGAQTFSWFGPGAGQQGVEIAKRSLEEAMRAMEIERGFGEREIEQAKRQIEEAMRQLEAQRGRGASALRTWRLDPQGRLLRQDQSEREEEVLENLEEALEDRLERIEEHLEDRMEAFEDRWEEVEDMLDRLFDRIEERLDRAFEERRRRDRDE
jgi:hypothetical protein